MFLTMGTGFGAGLILNDRLHAGASGLAGEVGHIRLVAEGHEAYGKKVSWEAFCGGNGIAELAARRADAAADQARLRELFPDGSGEALAARLAGALPALSLVGEAACRGDLSHPEIRGAGLPRALPDAGVAFL